LGFLKNTWKYLIQRPIFKPLYHYNVFLKILENTSFWTPSKNTRISYVTTMNETNSRRLQKSAIAPIKVIFLNGCFIVIEPSLIHMLQFKDITCTSNWHHIDIKTKLNEQTLIATTKWNLMNTFSIGTISTLSSTSRLKQ
jgi:hypothetical protein